MNESADIRGTIQAIAPKLEQLRGEIGKKIFGQQQLIDELLLALLCRSHCILTGVPGLAKTLLIKTLAEASELQFTRVQFTPDMMPADIIGSQIIEELPDGRRRFEFVKGPVFT
ncbi:AAA family ATPase, partial [Victivallis vadensis]